jgi:hypothetical protein
MTARIEQVSGTSDSLANAPDVQIKRCGNRMAVEREEGLGVFLAQRPVIQAPCSVR